MRQIPFYSEEEAVPLGWQRAAVSASSASEKRYDTLIDTTRHQLKRCYWSARWLLRHPGACTDVLAAQWRLLPARGGGGIVHIDGVKLRLRPEYSSRLARELLARTYAMSERALLRHALEDGDKVLEVGTGIGVIAALCARRLGCDRVVAYDAHPAMWRAARETFELNGLSPRLEHCALGRVQGRRILYAGETLGDAGPGRRPRRLMVPGRTLAEAVRTHRPTLLIIDVEGGECELMKDCVTLGVPKILIAFYPHLLGSAAVARARLTFAQAGYEAAAASADGNRVYYRLAAPRTEEAPAS